MVAIEQALRRVVELLVQKDYAALERITGGVRLTASEMESGVNDYPGTLTVPPPTAYSRADVIPIRNTSPQAYSVRFRLYTREERESDLELQATLIDNPAAGPMTIEIDDILVA